VFDEHGNPTGATVLRTEAHAPGAAFWHKTTHIWIVNKAGELLLQLRSPHKDVMPNSWDISAAGHIEAGESMILGSVREMQQELGVTISADQLKYLFTVTSARNHHFNDVFLIELNLPVTDYSFDDNEVVEVKYIPWRELAAMSPDEMSTNNIIWREEMSELFDYLEKNGY
jgi:isopentenyldiphosphate isomerase